MTIASPATARSMAPMVGAWFWDALVPGAVAALRGQWFGWLCALPALALWGIAVALGVLLDPAFARSLAPWLVGAWALLFLGARSAVLLSERPRKLDLPEVHKRAQQALSAWLRNEPQAETEARALTRLAPQLPGAWDLLALVVPASAAKARARARRLRAQHAERITPKRPAEAANPGRPGKV